MWPFYPRSRKGRGGSRCVGGLEQRDRGLENERKTKKRIFASVRFMFAPLFIFCRSPDRPLRIYASASSFCIFPLKFSRKPFNLSFFRGNECGCNKTIESGWRLWTPAACRLRNLWRSVQSKRYQVIRLHIKEKQTKQQLVFRSDTLAAVKVVKLEAGDNFAVIQQEIMVIRECSHPNIIAYFGSYIRRWANLYLIKESW